MGKLIRAEGIQKAEILHGIDFSMEEGELTAIMGPSGSGKSTFAYMLSGMDRADAGQITFLGEDITAMSEEETAGLRLKKMGFVFQQMNMLSNLNILDNIMLPAIQEQKKKPRRKRLTEADIRRQAEQIMQTMGIKELGDRMISQVSGGQLQRACICRALINEPSILIADEPTGALNRRASEEVMQELLRLNRTGMSTLIVTHDSRVAGMCDRVLYLLDGKFAGECRLGKYHKKDRHERERKLVKWLEEKHW